MKERPLTKENMGEPNWYRTPGRESESRGLERVRQAAKEGGKLQFTALLHHVNVDLLPACRSARPDSSRSLSSATVARSLDPEADGKQRPLGIAALEDKIDSER